MKKSTSYSPEVRDRAVRMVMEHRDDYPSEWAAIESIAGKIGCSAQTLHNWVRRQQIDTGVLPGPTTEERQRIKDLERDNRELRRANEILKLASAFFAQAEPDMKAPLCRIKCLSASSTPTETASGSSRSAECCRSPRLAIVVMPRNVGSQNGCRRAAGAT